MVIVGERAEPLPFPECQSAAFRPVRRDRCVGRQRACRCIPGQTTVIEAGDTTFRFFDEVRIRASGQRVFPAFEVVRGRGGFNELILRKLLDVLTRLCRADPSVPWIEVERRSVDVAAQCAEKHPLPALRYPAVCGVEQEELGPVADLTEPRHDHSRITPGVPEDHAFDVFRDSHLWSKPPDQVQVVEEQIGQNLPGLSLPEMLFLAPGSLPAAGHAECRTGRRSVEDVQGEEFFRKIHFDQVANRAQEISRRIQVVPVVPGHLRVDVVGRDDFTPGQLVAHAGAAAAGEGRHDPAPVLPHPVQIRQVPRAVRLFR